MAPLLTGKAPDFSDSAWTLTCLVVFATLVGIPCALFSRAAAAARRG
jgi:hypothetical protein